MRVLSLLNDAWTHSEIDSVPEVLDKIQEDRLTWVRAGGLEEETLATLGEAFGLHPLSIEDVLTARQRPKVEDYEDLTFALLRVPRYQDGELEWQQLGLFLGSDFLVTASARKLPELDELERRILAKGMPTDREFACFLMHEAVDRIVDAWLPFLDELEDSIETVEDQVLATPSQELLRDIRAVKAVVSKTRKVSTPMRDAMQSLERGDHPHVLPEVRVYLRDVSDHMVRVAERLEHVKEMTLIAQESWNSSLANQQNQVMKRLTVVAALLLFPSLVAGLGGMNFAEGFPNWSYWTVVAAIFLFVAVGGFLAWTRKWL